MHIVLLDRNTFADASVFPSARLAAQWQEYTHTGTDQIVARAAAADVLITNKCKLSGTVLEQLPRLKLIAAAATGVDHVDIAAARRRGIAVCNVRDYARHSVPEHVFALLLALRRNLLSYASAAHDGRWQGSSAFCLHDRPIEDLAGTTLGIIGGGTLGQGVAKLAAAFSMQVLYAERRGVSPRPGYTAFEQVLTESDVVSLHVPLTPETRHLIGAPELARMRPTAILVNAARGGIVDEDALLDALRAGRLAGAALDVLTTEPPTMDHPLLVANLPNLIVTPHIAWASRQAQQYLVDAVVANIAAFMRGERYNRVV